MGGSNSAQDNRKPVKGGIYVQLSKTGFISGEVIHGTLQVSLEENFQGHILQVGLEGIEETHYTYRVRVGHGKHRRTRLVRANGLNKFLDFTLPVYDFAQGRGANNFQMSPGQWTIPFSLNVANSIPSSLVYFLNDSTNCNLKYRVIANIIPTDPSIRPLQGAQDVLIAQQLNMMAVQQIKSFDLAPNTCCCCGADQFSISGSTDKPCYSPGETIRVLINSDLSKYGKTVNRLSVELQGQLTLSAQVGVPKTMIIYQSEKKIEVNGKTIKESVEIQIPPSIHLTCKGSLIKLEYSVKIKPEISTCCSCENGKTACYFPLMINPTNQTLNVMQMPQLFAVQTPQNWNPTQLQPTQFSAQQATYIQQQQAQFHAMQQQQQMQQFDQSTLLGGNGDQSMQMMQMNQSHANGGQQQQQSFL